MRWPRPAHHTVNNEKQEALRANRLRRTVSSLRLRMAGAFFFLLAAAASDDDAKLDSSSEEDE